MSLRVLVDSYVMRVCIVSKSVVDQCFLGRKLVVKYTLAHTFQLWLN